MRKGQKTAVTVSELTATKIENVLLHSQVVPQQLRQRYEAELKQTLAKIQDEYNKLVEEARKEVGADKAAIYNAQTKSFEVK